MPLQTFFNLREERQQEIVDASYEEFAINTYKTASVSNIVKKLNIAKGSFYRYFKNKLDLYNYLIEVSYEIRMKQLDELIIDESLTFFDILRENFRDKLKFDLEHPVKSSFMYNVMLEWNTKELEHIVNSVKRRAIDLTEDMIIQYQQAGKLNPDIRPEIAAHLIMQVQLGIYDYLALFKGVNFKENIRRNQHVFNIDEDELLGVARHFADIIKSGLENKMNTK